MRIHLVLLLPILLGILASPSWSDAFPFHYTQQSATRKTATLLYAYNLFDEDGHATSSSSSSSSPDLSRREAWQQAAAMTTTASGLLVPRSALAEKAIVTTTPIPTVKLGGSSLEVSRTIQGHWQLSGGHGKIREQDALANMDAHFRAGITTLDTADIYGPSELIVGKYMARNPQAIPMTKFCCFRFLDEITRDEVRQRVQKVRTHAGVCYCE